MIKEGTGGRSYPGERNERVLEGVLSDGRSTRPCANPRCNRVFTPRQDGDLYCCEACDLDDNPYMKGRK